MYGGVLAAYHKANSHLEEGVLAELDGKPNAIHFRAALAGYETMAKEMVVLEQLMADQVAIDKAGSKLRVATYDTALTKVLQEAKFERLALHRARYSNAAGATHTQPTAPVKNLTEIVVAQHADLLVLQKKLTEVLDSLRSALPIAEKGEFVPVMLSGRNGFGDKMPEFTDMISAYERFNIQSCMATIDATMQAYPAGFEWLKKPK